MMPDQTQRDAALDPRRSFIVQAPAGSGKTDLLVRRYLKLLSLVQKPEEILAITFTRKAAAEMRKRVLEQLDEARRREIAHRLRIQTIDALCAALTRRMPVLARFGAQPQVVEDATELYLEAAARVLARLGGPAERLLRHLDNDVPLATRLLADLLRSRDRWLRKAGAAPTREELEATLLFQRNKAIETARALDPRASEEFAHEVLTKGLDWRKKNPVAQALAGNEPLRAALAALRTLPPARYDDRQWEALGAIVALLFPAVAELKVLFGERGAADFTELAHGALQALGSAEDPSELLLGLDQKLSHILVDEFQDTSESQFALLEQLTLGWAPGDGRTLFLVGDPMQSIYRFREAEVGLFLRARREGLGAVALEPLTLGVNRRSQAGLVAWFNAAFPGVFPAAEDEASGAVPYLAATPFEPALPGEAVSWHCFYDRESEAARVVELVKNSSGKKAILVRNRNHLDEIVPALDAAGVRWRALQIEQLGERQGVQDLFALTRALSHLGDRTAWLALLRAPWCGLVLEDLARLAEGERDALVWDLLQNPARLSADGRARATRLRDALAPAVAARLRGTLRDAVEGAWLALGGPACVPGATGLEDAERFLDELEALEDAGAADIEALAGRLEKLWALPDVEAPPDAVEIMTIHRAKGLEFDTVIVPGLDRLPRSGPRPLFAWKVVAPPTRGGHGGLLLAPIDESGAGEDPTYKYVRELEREADDIEAGRLFYVAATRAKKHLHLLACARVDAEGALREPAGRSLLAKVWEHARPHFGPAPASPPDDAAREPLPDFLRRLPAGFAPPPPPEPVRWTAPAEEAPEAEAIEFSWARETARHVGTVAHRWLQRIAEDSLRGWDEARVRSLAPAFRRELERQGVPPAELERSAARVAEALAGALADERGRWVLGPHADARSEYRLRVREGRRTRGLAVDRVFRDADGTRWIVDYKTSSHEGADLERFLDQERSRYAAQLRRYGAALPGSRLGLYFPLLRGWREAKD